MPYCWLIVTFVCIITTRAYIFCIATLSTSRFYNYFIVVMSKSWYSWCLCCFATCTGICFYSCSCTSWLFSDFSRVPSMFVGWSSWFRCISIFKITCPFATITARPALISIWRFWIILAIWYFSFIPFFCKCITLIFPICFYVTSTIKPSSNIATFYTMIAIISTMRLWCCSSSTNRRGCCYSNIMISSIVSGNGKCSLK